MLGLVYLLHFSRPISEAHSCQHYLGWCLDINARLAMHRAGKGARLTQVAVERGIGFEVVRTWEGSRELERHLKNSKRGPRLCPLCRQIHGLAAQPATIDVTQLQLPLEAPPDFPEPPRLAIGWSEIQAQRAWRVARADLIPLARAIGGDDDLL